MPAFTNSSFELINLSSSPTQKPFLSRFTGTRFWVIDSDQNHNKALEDLLATSGWRWLTITSATSADSLLRDTTPDVLLVDKTLRDGSGVEFTRKIRLTGKEIPVIMMSTMATSSERIEGLEAGAQDYLSKPFSGKELLLRIERILELRTPRFAQARRSQENIYQISSLLFDPIDKHLLRNKQNVDITQGDALLLESFCKAPEQVLERDELCRRCVTLTSANNSRTIDVRISRLRRLLNQLEPGLGEALETIRGRGYRLNAPTIRLPKPTLKPATDQDQEGNHNAQASSAWLCTA